MEIGPFHCSGDSHISFISACKNPFSFIDTPMILPVEGISLGNNCRLARPNQEQLGLIRERLFAIAPESKFEYRFEYNPINERGGGTRFDRLEANEFRYATLQFTGDQSHANAIEEASNLCELEFNIIGTWLPYGQVGKAIPALSCLLDWRTVMLPPIVVREEHICELVGVQKSSLETRKSIPVFGPAINLCSAIKALPRMSPFRIVASFSLVELLIIDGTKPIKTQVSRKIPEICRRSIIANYPRKPEALWSNPEFWKAIYNCRSEVAHNGVGRFPPKGIFGFHSVEAVCDELSKLNKFLLRACTVDRVYMSEIKLK